MGGSTLGRDVLQEVRLSDGSILSLEAVTFGTRHRRDLGRWRGNGLVAEAETPEDRVVVWMSRHEPRTGRALDFDWWSRCEAVDPHGCRIPDDDAVGRHYWQESGGVAETARRPLISLDRKSTEQIAVHCTLRKFRTAGARFRLRVFDSSGSAVAEFDAPYPDPANHPEWSPEPLPVVRREGDLSLSLTGLTASRATGCPGVETWRLEPTYKLSVRGRPTEDWAAVRLATFSDPLGNVCAQDQCDLCPFEPAWTMRAVVRPDPARHTRSDVLEVAGLAVPEKGTTNPIGRGSTLHGIPVELASTGGGGNVSYTDPDAPEPRSASASGRGSGIESRSIAPTTTGRSR